MGDDINNKVYFDEETKRLFEKRIKTLEFHANGNEEKYRRWAISAALSFIASIGLFIWFISINGVHDHFLTFEFDDGGDFISVYDKPISSFGHYVMALALGVSVSFTEKILTIPGQKVMHSFMEKNFNLGSFLGISLFETANVAMAMMTTFLYFTNVAILLCVLFGRMIGILIVHRFFYEKTCIDDDADKKTCAAVEIQGKVGETLIY